MPSDNYIDEVFGEGGSLSLGLPGYRVRDGQIFGAKAIEFALEHEENVAIEAPTGIGKSMMYLVPAIQRGRVLVSTANTTLQDQLVNKDLPMLRKILGKDFSFALLKGRQNYLCLRSAEEAENLLFQESSELKLIDQVLKWAKESTTGDKNEIPFQVEPVWHRFSVSGEECIGSRCKFRESCKYERARSMACSSDVVVTNHMMLALHLRVLSETGEHVILPKFSRLVIDEAHELPAYARKVWGVKVSHGSVLRAITPWKRISLIDLADIEDKSKKTFAKFRSELDKLKDASPRITAEEASQVLTPLIDRFYELTETARKAVIGVPAKSGDSPASSRMKAVVDEVGLDLPVVPEKDLSTLSESDWEKFKSGEGRITLLISRMERLREQSDDIRWLEVDRELASVQSTVLDVGTYVRDLLFDRIPTAIAVSATLASGSGPQAMKYMEGELGLSRHRSYVIPSPFDLPRQLRIIAPEMPDPNSPEFTEVLSERLYEVVTGAHGRTLILFTSFRSMNAVYDYFVTRGIEYRILKQGDSSTPRLIEEFKRDIHSVLLGVASLWTGIDVPGEALSCLAIDKFPFTPPTDPILAAFQEKYGRDCFYKIQVPSAVMRFRQGAGRLIRTDTDKGVLAIMDNRLTKKPYGRQFIAAFDGVQVRSSTGGIEEFLAESTEDV